MITAHWTTRLAVIGDSIVAGGGYDVLATRLRRFYRGGAAIYPGNKSVGTTTFRALPTYVNAGVSGNRVADVDARVVADIVNLSLQPTLVLIAIGVNDVNGGTDLTAFSTSYASVLTKLLAGGILAANIGCVNVSTTGADGESIPSAADATIATYNTLIAAAAAFRGATLGDLRAANRAWEPINNPLNEGSGHATVDGTHPTAAGTVLIADTCQSFITFAPL